MNTSSKVLIGILGAAAAGVVIGLLIAPEKGSEMRDRLKKSAGDWADSLSNLFVRGKEEAENMAGNAMNAGRNAASTAEDKINNLKENFS